MKKQCDIKLYTRINKKIIRFQRCLYEKNHNNVHYNDYTIWFNGNTIKDIF